MGGRQDPRLGGLTESELTELNYNLIGAIRAKLFQDPEGEPRILTMGETVASQASKLRRLKIISKESAGVAKPSGALGVYQV